MGPELDGSYPMHKRHVLRGGLVTVGLGVGAMLALLPGSGDEDQPKSGSPPARLVVQAGPGPATPVEGAITLIDPLVIER